jgi:hypothetical protein
MKRNAIGLLVAALAFTGVARGADPAPTIEDVKKAWKARQDVNKSFRIQWVESGTIKAGSYDNPGGTEPPGPHPPKDHEITATCSFAADGEKLAFADERMIYFPEKQTWVPYARSHQFDGKTWMTVYPQLRRGWGDVQVETGFSRNSGVVTSLTNQAVRMAYRPLTGPAPFDFGVFKFSGRTTKIGEAECIEMVLTDKAKKDGPPGYDYSLWCDPERGFLPVRWKQRYASGGYDLDWEYRKDDQGRWVPSGWQRTTLNPKGAVTYTTKAEVKKLELDHTFAADAFAPKPPPSSHVTVYENGDTKEEYLLRPDGSKRPLKPSERDKDYNEVIKTNADGTPYVPAKK